MISYYPEGLADVRVLWRGVIAKGEAYADCVGAVYLCSLNAQPKAPACGNCDARRAAFESAVDRLDAALLEARRYVWRDLGLSPVGADH